MLEEEDEMGCLSSLVRLSYVPSLPGGLILAMDAGKAVI